MWADFQSVSSAPRWYRYKFLLGFGLGFGFWFLVSLWVCVWVLGTEFGVCLPPERSDRTEREWMTNTEAVYNVCSCISKRILTEPSSATRLTFSYVTACTSTHFCTQRLLFPLAIYCSNQSSDKCSCKRRFMTKGWETQMDKWLPFQRINRSCWVSGEPRKLWLWFRY